MNEELSHSLLLRMTLGRFVILNKVKDLELK
jgi:hypothetical protein